MEFKGAYQDKNDLLLNSAYMREALFPERLEDDVPEEYSARALRDVSDKNPELIDYLCGELEELDTVMDNEM